MKLGYCAQELHSDFWHGWKIFFKKIDNSPLPPPPRKQLIFF